MKVTIMIDGMPAEIAALVVGLQERQFSEEGPIRLTAEEAARYGSATHEQLRKTP